MLKTLLNLLNKTHLNLGIKRSGYRLWLWLDSQIVSQLFKALYLYLTRRIINYYGADYRWGDEKSQNINKKNGSLGYGLLHYSLIGNMNAKRILCIGSMYGFIPFICALACKYNNRGHVDFVDADYDIADPQDAGRHNFGQGFWRKVDPQKHFSFLGIERWISTYVLTSQQFARRYPKRRYEYIYVDGDHSYEGAKMDYNLFWSRLKEGGFMVFHDVEKRGNYKGIEFGYWKLWEEIKSQKDNSVVLHNPVSGVGIIQKE